MAHFDNMAYIFYDFCKDIFMDFVAYILKILNISVPIFFL